MEGAQAGLGGCPSRSELRLPLRMPGPERVGQWLGHTQPSAQLPFLTPSCKPGPSQGSHGAFPERGSRLAARGGRGLTVQPDSSRPALPGAPTWAWGSFLLVPCPPMTQKEPPLPCPLAASPGAARCPLASPRGWGRRPKSEARVQVLALGCVPSGEHRSLWVPLRGVTVPLVSLGSGWRMP